MRRARERMTVEAGHRLNILLTALLSVAALATSWAGYQASLWNGNQASHDGTATALRTNSTRETTRAGQLRIIDLQVFTAWVAAYTGNDTLVSAFYERRFRPEFRPAFAAWIASRPLRSPDAAPSPFNLPEYRLAADAEAGRLATAADKESVASQHANRMSDSYVLDAVVLAAVMSIASGAQGRSSARIRLCLLVIASVMCAAVLYRLVTSPLG
ncbi:MAG: hypothetical protein ACJ8AD_09825 [Gemmatimonadaceae bacterium]